MWGLNSALRLWGCRCVTVLQYNLVKYLIYVAKKAKSDDVRVFMRNFVPEFEKTKVYIMDNIKIIKGVFDTKLELKDASVVAGFPSPVNDYSHETHWTSTVTASQKAISKCKCLEYGYTIIL